MSGATGGLSGPALSLGLPAAGVALNELIGAARLSRDIDLLHDTDAAGMPGIHRVSRQGLLEIVGSLRRRR